MINVNEELIVVLNEFYNCFGYNVPLFQIPSTETNDKLMLNLKICIRDKKDHLKDIYNFKYSEEIHY